MKDVEDLRIGDSSPKSNQIKRYLAKEDNVDDKSNNKGVVQCKSRNNATEIFMDNTKRNLAPKAKPINVCVCKDNFVGRTCDECAYGFYGEN